jgi:5-methylcytosine-specific restriction endonuclease McrA
VSGFPVGVRKKAGRQRGWVCQKCGRRFKDGWLIEAHHILPSSAGGPDTLENLILLCTLCHLKAHQELRRRGIDHPRSVGFIKRRLDNTFGGRTRAWIVAYVKRLSK